jgi:hypothetical protein
VSVCTHLSTVEVGDLLGLTYRQLDYVSRTVLKDVPGSGNRRRWDDASVERLTVAKALLDAIDALVHQKHSPWPQLVDAVMAAGDPLPGWVTLSPEGRVTYLGRVDPHGHVGLSARWRPVKRAVTS